MKVLVLAPHADDETLGCGGTIARLAGEGHEVVVGLITGQGQAPHPLFSKDVFDTIQSELRDACDVLGVARIEMLDLPTVLLPDLPRHVLNHAITELIRREEPSMLFVPFPLDLHGDHREVFHAASIAWRPYLPSGHRIREVYCYEVPSETHLNIPYVEQAFVPNVYFDISEWLEVKLSALERFESQSQLPPLPRSSHAIRTLAHFRGSQIGVVAAEAFVSVRVLK
jgi:LmbE family N-acetylglucosaminyl deacetylase